MGLPAAQPKRLTPAEYLRRERDATERHEYRDGEVVAVSGGTGEQSLIAANLIGELGNRLKGGPCRVYDSSLRVAVKPGTRYVYPDASVICGLIDYDTVDDARHTATNPRVIFEVFSPSTEGYDRGEKFRRYLKVPSFEEYVLVSQAMPVVETYTRQADGSWVFRAFEGVEAVARVTTVGVDLPLAAVFAGVQFPPPAEPPSFCSERGDPAAKHTHAFARLRTLSRLPAWRRFSCSTPITPGAYA